jgi:UDP-glucose 4-epimerase
MNVCVVGGAGYIGSHVVVALLEQNHSVLVYDNMSSGDAVNLQKGAAFVKGDILDQPYFEQTLRDFKADAVIHLAAFKAAGESMIVPSKYSENNIAGSIRLLNACDAVGVKNIVFSSTAAVYGEPKYNPIDEKHPTEPMNYYGFTKLNIEMLLKWYSQLKGIRFAALRYFNAAGYDTQMRVVGLERNPANLLPVVMEVAAGIRAQMQVFGDDYPTPDGSGVRDYIHVSDLADAHVKALDYLQKEQKDITVNLGTQVGASVLEMIRVAEEITGKKVTHQIVARREGDPAELYATAALAQELLGWKPQFSDIQTLIQSTWNVYLKNLSAKI